MQCFKFKAGTLQESSLKSHRSSQAIANSSSLSNSNDSQNQLRSKKSTSSNLLGNDQSKVGQNENPQKFLGLHIINLRRANLINIISSKSSDLRSEGENKLIMEILRHEQFFRSISANSKLLYEISSKIQYKSAKEGTLIYRINEFTEGYFILIRGSVQLSIPQKIIMNSPPISSKDDQLLKQIQKNQQVQSINKLNFISSSNKFEKVSDSFFSLKKQKSNQKQPSTFDIKKSSKPTIGIEFNQDNSKKISSFEFNSDSKNKKYQCETPSKLVQHKKLTFHQSNQAEKIDERKHPVLKIDKALTKILPKSPLNEKKQHPSLKTLQELNLQNKTSPNINAQLEQFWSPTQLDLDLGSKTLSQSSFNQQSIPDTAKNQEFKIESEEHLQYIDKIVHIVEEGECFGQITVGQVNKRATNAKSKQDCHLILIKKQHYELISRASLGTQMKRRHNFLLNLQLFKKVYRYGIESFLYYMTEVTCQYKTSLYKQGQQIQYIYLIRNGEFNFSKTINEEELKTKNHKKIYSLDENSELNCLRRKTSKWREGIFKKIYPGQIIGDCETFLKKVFYYQTCTCASQLGSYYKIEKNIFLEKLMATENQVPQIKKYLSNKYRSKLKFIQNFIQKQLSNQIISRILPASQSQDRKLYKKLPLQQSESSNDNESQRKGVNSFEFKRKSSYTYFDDFNRTFHPNKSKRRLCTRRAINVKDFTHKAELNEKIRCKTVMNKTQVITQNFTRQKLQENNFFNTQRKQVPACIKDVVSVVRCKQRYFKTRNSDKDTEITFEFQKHKLPRFIQQKYKHLITQLKNK